MKATTVLGHITAQDIVDTVANSKYIFALERKDDGEPFVYVNEDGIATEAESLFDIKAPNFFEASAEDFGAVANMLRAEARRTMPSVDEIADEEEHPQEDYDRTEAAALKA